ncbi:MAG: glycoside hydrolase family 2 [Prevotellaceae bacterium]|jgi:hypothetical protein|nr:glycoside hydrolase family 2 [Prevotellaceae bacterium]
MKSSNKNNSVSRRKFIKSGMILTAGLPVMRMYPFSFSDINSANQENGDELYSLFCDPPVTAKPFVRWWWNGDKVTASELLRELDVLKDAGIGGVEINPIKFPVADDLAIPSLPWLSPEWIEMVKITLKGAEERGLVCDIIVGSGWPFGAEFLEGDERSQLITIASRKVQGTGVVSIETAGLLKEAAPQISSRGQGDSEIEFLCLAPLQMDTFAQPQWLPFDKTQETLKIQVPEGEYILYAIVKVTGFQSVIQGTVGAGGPVLNHYDKDATLRYLNRMSDALFPELKGLKSFRSIFCDSMELEGANWGPGYLDEFKRRRGYDIKPYLPFILFKVGGMGHAIKGTEITQLSGEAKEEVSRARYDFTVTCMELIRERFLLTYTEWCNKHGFLSRVQTYGNEFHPLHASMDIDIPECETWTGHPDTPNAYTPVNKFVASAARLSGKKIVSCEEVTDIHTTFNVTLEKVKIVCDQSNLSGVTHSILCGYNYSPLTAPYPGWVRYGTFFDERNTWWEYFKQFAAYKTRLSALLQETEPYADIAVLHPLADMWTIYGPQRDPFPERWYPSYQYKVWEGIHRNGNGCDYTSEEIIVKSVSENGFLKYGNRKYHTLILLEVESMTPATAKALSTFVRNGGKLIFVGKEPHKSQGLKNHKKNDRQVATTIASMKKAYPSRIFTVAPPEKDIVAWFAGVQQQCGVTPYMKIDRPSEFVSQIRQQAAGKDIFFVSNCSPDERITLHVSFPESKGTPWLWDAETGERYLYPSVSGDTLTVDLSPAASQLIVFDTSGVRDVTLPAQPPETAGAELNGWLLRMEHVNGTERQRNINALFDLKDDETTRSFAGRLYYEKRLPDNISQYHWLDLGKVHGVSEVMLDETNLGNHWYGRHLYRLPDNAGGKTLRIKITTTQGNFLKSTPENKAGYVWTQYQQWAPAGMLGPVKLL